VSKPVFHERVAFEYDTLSLALCLGWKIYLSLDHTPIRLQIGLRSLLLSQYFQDSCHVVNMFKKDVQPKNPSIASAIPAVFNPSIASAILESVLNYFLL
jgi:hypothetical protein